MMTHRCFAGRTALRRVGCAAAAFALATGAAQAAPPSATDVLSYHADNANTGLYDHETVLTPATVNAQTFGLQRRVKLDGKVNAQPLYMAGLTVTGQKHDVLFVATEHDSVYALDAVSGKTLWKTSVLGPGEQPSDPLGCSQVKPEIGITATPVIDANSGTLYAVAMSKDSAGHYHQRLIALDVSTGKPRAHSPTEITASYPGDGDHSQDGKVVFDPKQYNERAALLLDHGTVYTSWASHCDHRPYTGWVIAFNAKTLQRSGVLNLVPNGNEGAMWSSGGGPVADAAGNVYVMDGNGSFDSHLDGQGFPANGDYGNAFVKLKLSGDKLAVVGYFQNQNQQYENDHDVDLGSGGPMLLGDPSAPLVTGAGKARNIYLLDTRHMGGFHPDGNQVHQELKHALDGPEFGSPAYFNHTVYYGAVGSPLLAFKLQNGKLSSAPMSKTATRFGYPGTTPSVSANGSAGGIVWAVENSSPAVLHAYAAGDLSRQLYDSNQASGGRDHFGDGNKFITPISAGGRVVVGTPDGVAIFGMLQKTR